MVGLSLCFAKECLIAFTDTNQAKSTETNCDNDNCCFTLYSKKWITNIRGVFLHSEWVKPHPPCTVVPATSNHVPMCVSECQRLHLFFCMNCAQIKQMSPHQIRLHLFVNVQHAVLTWPFNVTAAVTENTCCILYRHCMGAIVEIWCTIFYTLGQRGEKTSL